MDYIQILFTGIDETQSEIVIALLSNIGFEGFQEESNLLKALVQTNQFDENLFDKFIETNNFKYSKSIIKEQNWNEKWEADFEPVRVQNPITSEPFVYIRASFHKPDNLYKYNIEVTPKMSFGTGHHATTYLMVQNMSAIDFTDKTVIDFGTGTGVLAILAEKLGAKSIIAIDNDEWSINNAKENILVNDCGLIKIELAETISPEAKADVILANINLNIIKENISAIKGAAKETTIFLFSGIMLHDENNILGLLASAGLKVGKIFRKENWLCILASF